MIQSATDMLLSLVFFCSNRQDPLTITMVPPGVKLLVYKDCKKNIHRVMKFRTDRKNSLNNRNGNELELTGDDQQDDQWLKDNKQTMEVIDITFRCFKNMSPIFLSENYRKCTTSARNWIHRRSHQRVRHRIVLKSSTPKLSAKARDLAASTEAAIRKSISERLETDVHAKTSIWTIDHIIC